MNPMNPLDVKVPGWAREIGKAALKAFAVGLATTGATQLTRRTSEAYERRRVEGEKRRKQPGYSVPNNSTTPGPEGAEA
jgi:hypothetical protein